MAIDPKSDPRAPDHIFQGPHHILRVRTKGKEGLVLFRFNLRLSGPLPDLGYLAEIQTRKGSLHLFTGKMPDRALVKKS